MAASDGEREIAKREKIAAIFVCVQPSHYLFKPHFIEPHEECRLAAEHSEA